MAVTLEMRKTGKGKASTWRRYPAGKHEAYDKVYMRERARSHILNAGRRTVWDVCKYDNLQGLKNELWHYIGNEDGTLGEVNLHVGSVKLDETYRPEAIIPAMLHKLIEINKGRKEYREKEKKGLSVSFGQWNELERKRLEAEALIDVCGAEAEWLEKEILKFESKKQVVDDKNILKHGPQFSRWGDPPKEVDGQKVGMAGDEGLEFYIIDDERSPYNGMSLKDYKDMALEWLKSERVKTDQLRQQRDEEIKQKGHSNIYVPMGPYNVSKEDLPPWPEDVVNHKQIDKKKSDKK